MGLLDATPPQPPHHSGRYILVAMLLAIIAGGVAYYFWNYPEEHAVSRFLRTVQSGDYKTAYGLWQPSSTYTFADFMKDWGPNGDYGKIREFDILRSSSASSDTVTVTVMVNRETPVLKLLVDKNTKGLAYSPY
jgi:hypothetical protein